MDDTYKYSALDANHLSEREYPLEKSWSLDTCSVGGNISKQATRKLENFVSTLHTIIPPPEEFLKEFRNPCWYMHLSISPRIAKLLLHKGHSLSESAASSILSEVLRQRNLREATVEKKSLVCIPKVFFIGFPRSGSTHLYKMLVRNPQLRPGYNKEPHWWTRFPFTAKFPLNTVAIMRYLVQFQEASRHIVNHPNTLTIDGSQSTIWDMRYTYNANPCLLPSLISSIVPQAKYIIILREPISRLYSDFTYLCESYWKLNKLTIPSTFLRNAPDMFHNAAIAEIRQFKACLEKSSVDICTHYATYGSALRDVTSSCGRVRLGISIYYVHISRWLKMIPEKSFHFVKTEDMAQQPYGVLRRVWQFLEVPPQKTEELDDILFEHQNSNFVSQVKSIAMKRKTQAMLQEFFQPYNKKLAELLNNTAFLWK